MIFVSSIAAAIPLPGYLTYSATKTFATYIGEGLYYELQDTVDVISFRPGNVDTNMNPYDDEKNKGGDYISPAYAASYCFRDLGY